MKTLPKSRGSIWWKAARPKTLPAAMAPIMVASALAWRDGGFDGVAASLCLSFALLIQIGTNFANDYYDFVKGADTKDRVGPVRAVVSGAVAPVVMRRAMGVALLSAFALGLSLMAWGGPWLLVVGVASVLCAIAYTGGPYPLGYHGWGDVFVFLFFGLVAVGATYYVQVGNLTADTWLLAVPIGLLSANILVVNNYRDVATDRMAGKRTLVVRFGEGFARAQFNACLFVAAAVPVVAAVRFESALLLFPGVLIPMGWSHRRRLAKSKTPSELIELLGDSGKLLALYALLLSAGIVLAGP